jgi:RNA polymerase sigma-70 factor (ECF subfamily)
LITEPPNGGNDRRVRPSFDAALLFAPPERVAPPEAAATLQESLDFDDVYERHFPFVWRNLRRLGVPDAQIDDAAQDVFVVIHRKLSGFEARSSLRTWIFGILARVAADYRRSLRRKSPHSRAAGAAIEADTVADEGTQDAHDRFVRLEGVQLLHKLLDELDDDKRAVLVLAELEQMGAPEIAEALGVNLNTVYARLRAARQAFAQAVARERARDAWRLR